MLRNKEKNDMKVTLRDIAKQTNVAASTVSRALTGKPGVSDELRDYLQRVAKDMGYEPPPRRDLLLARRTQSTVQSTPKTRTIRALLLNTFRDHMYYESRLLAGIVSHSQREGIQVLVDIFEDGRGPRTPDEWMPNTCDGLIIIGARADQEFPRSVRNFSSRVVLIERLMLNANFSSVMADDTRGGYLATRHLINHGHRNIALVTRPRRHSESLYKRQEGYQAALREAGIEPTEALITYADGWNPAEGERAMNRLLSEGTPFTAVFGCTDRLATGALRSIKNVGKRVPEDISIVGFDDVEMARILDPPLTTVQLPMFELGYEAARLLSEVREEELFRPRQVVLTVELVERGSTGPAPA